MNTKQQPTVRPTGGEGSRGAQIAAEQHKRRAEMIDYKTERASDQRAARRERRTKRNNGGDHT